MVGIFRISANGIDLNKLRDEINAGEKPNWDLYLDEPHLVTGILKHWLRALPTPLVSPFSEWSTVSGTYHYLEPGISVVRSLPHLTCFHAYL